MLLQITTQKIVKTEFNEVILCTYNESCIYQLPYSLLFNSYDLFKMTHISWS